MARLCLRLGGPKLLYALHKYTRVPSLSTTKRHADRVHVLPSLSTPVDTEISHNIRSVAQHFPARSRRGHSLQIDEVSLEERCRYFKGTSSVGGLCREHVKGLDIRPTTFDGVIELATSVEQKICHIASDATVAAVGAFGKDSYSPMPILVSPTCKAEAPENQIRWFKIILSSWKELAQDHGEIWCISSDGDSGRRSAFHQFLMQRTPSSDSPLHRELAYLSLFNIQTGPDDITMDFDYKHILKRESSLL